MNFNSFVGVEVWFLCQNLYFRNGHYIRKYINFKELPPPLGILSFDQCVRFGLRLEAHTVTIIKLSTLTVCLWCTFDWRANWFEEVITLFKVEYIRSCIAPEILKWQSVFLFNLGRLNDFICQKCIKLKLRSAFVPTWSWIFS